MSDTTAKIDLGKFEGFDGAEKIAASLFDGRKGHGGGPCSYLQLSREELANIIEGVVVAGRRQILAYARDLETDNAALNAEVARLRARVHSLESILGVAAAEYDGRFTLNAVGRRAMAKDIRRILDGDPAPTPTQPAPADEIIEREA